MKVAVLSGGRSSEHEVSLASGRSVADALQGIGHEVLEIEIDRSGVWHYQGKELPLVPGRGLLGVEAVFPALHGPNGEDGTVQGLLECLDVPYVGADVYTSSLCMDKVQLKRVLAQAGLPQVEYRAVEERVWRSEPELILAEVADIGFPLFTKPARLGSSIGITMVKEADHFEAALEAAFAHDTRALVERAALGTEIECSILGNDEPIPSLVAELVYDNEWFDYEAKYTEGKMELVVPARVSEAMQEETQHLALKAFQAVNCCGLARIDFLTQGSQVLVNEVNTIPGFTELSTYGQMFAASGIPYPELLDRLVKLGVEQYHKRHHKLF